MVGGNILSPSLSDSDLCSSCLASPMRTRHRAGGAGERGKVLTPDPSSVAPMLCALGQACNLSGFPVLLPEAAYGTHSINVNPSSFLPEGGAAHSLEGGGKHLIKKNSAHNLRWGCREQRADGSRSIRGTGRPGPAEESPGQLSRMQETCGALACTQLPPGPSPGCLQSGGTQQGPEDEIGRLHRASWQTSAMS